MGQRNGNGKVAAGNLTAQIFGLYWYPDCNKPENNWSVGDVRMRMFNPSYVFYLPQHIYYIFAAIAHCHGTVKQHKQKRDNTKRILLEQDCPKTCVT
jgi:hypothetical protein